MQPSVDYIKASDGAANASLMTISTVRAPLASTILVNTVANVPTKFMGSMGTPNTFIDPITGETITVISEATAVDFAGHVDGSNIEIDEIAPGYTDNGSEVGDIIIIRPTTQWADNLGDVVKTQAINPTGMVVPFAGSSAPDNWLMCDGASLLRADYQDLFDIIGTTYGSVDGTHFNVPDLRSRTPVGVGTGTFAETIAAAAVTPGTDLLTVSAAGGLQLLNGRAVVLSTTGTAPGGLTAGNTYYVIAVSATTIKLASSLANAVSATPIDITTQGTGNHTLTMTLTTRALGDRGGEEAHANTVAELAAHNHAFSSYAVGSSNGAQMAAANGSIVSGPSTNGTNVSTGGSAAHNNMQPFLALNYIIKT